jgi:hypothetical protein
VTQLDVAGGKLHWDKNYDGTIDTLGRSVRGAVDGKFRICFLFVSTADYLLLFLDEEEVV